MGLSKSISLFVLLLMSLLYIIASVVTTILSDEKVNKQNGHSNVEQDHHDDQDGSGALEQRGQVKVVPMQGLIAHRYLGGSGPPHGRENRATH